ncbi:MAG TPA: glycosyltransferase family 1 protein [Mycobacteriales bacterium]|nr:glycosyltransferase family 1 protein [Mycobacteriales bacterium]
MENGSEERVTPRIRVALDARSIQEQPPNGVGRVTRQVLPVLADRVDFELMTQCERPPIEMGLPEHPLRTPWPGLASGWLQLPAARWLKRFDGIFHCPWYALPFVQHVPMVVTLHDLTFERHPEWFGRARCASYVVQARWAARTARSILTTSHQVADDVMRTYRVPAERLFVARPAVEPIFRPGVDATGVLDRLGIRRPYVVAVGGGSPRRNLPAAVEAWRAVRREHPIDLVVLGSNPLPPETGLVVTPLTDEDWVAVLGGALALLYPTRYEGFGLPAVEAAACGTPVVCAPVGSLPEVLGETAAWCAEPEASAVADVLRRLVSSPQWADELSAAGLDRVQSMSSLVEPAEAFLAAYSRAAS